MKYYQYQRLTSISSIKNAFESVQYTHIVGKIFKNQNTWSIL